MLLDKYFCFVPCFHFNADPDPTFYLIADPDPEPDPGSQTNADPYTSGSWSDFAVTESWLLTLNCTLVGNVIKHIYVGTKAVVGLFVTFVQFPCSRYPVPDPHSQCGSGSETLVSCSYQRQYRTSPYYFWFLRLREEKAEKRSVNL
jgi:hypothetical protein